MPRQGTTTLTVPEHTKDALDEYKGGHETWEECFARLLEEAQEGGGGSLSEADVNRIREGVRKEVRDQFERLARH